MNASWDFGTFTEPSAVAADGSDNLFVAWSEDDGAGTGEIWVKEHVGNAWVLVGAKVSGVGSATDPDIAFIAGEPWVTWSEDVGGVSTVFVSRFDGSDWVSVGGAVNNNPGANAYTPKLVEASNVPYVAFREESGMTRVFVKSWQ